MKKLSLLLALCLLVLVAFLWLFLSKNKNEVSPEYVKMDVSDAGFQYDVPVCDKYFKLVECIINNDPSQVWDQQMRLELKNTVKATQEEWKQLSEDELTKKCTEELTNYENLLEENNADSFGCLTKN